MKEVTANDLLGMLDKSEDSEKKVFAMVVKNDADDIVTGYVHDGMTDAGFNDTLRKLATLCDNLHAAMRWELCDGW